MREKRKGGRGGRRSLPRHERKGIRSNERHFIISNDLYNLCTVARATLTSTVSICTKIATGHVNCNSRAFRGMMNCGKMTQNAREIEMRLNSAFQLTDSTKL